MSPIPVREGHDWRQATAPTCGKPCISGTRATIAAENISAHVQVHKISVPGPADRPFPLAPLGCNPRGPSTTRGARPGRGRDLFINSKGILTMRDHTRDHCDICQSETFSEGVFKMGKLWCRECFSGRTAPVAMPPTAAQRLQLDMWLAPHPSSQAFNLAQATQPARVSTREPSTRCARIENSYCLDAGSDANGQA